jgi:hypothetical protein
LKKKTTIPFFGVKNETADRGLCVFGVGRSVDLIIENDEGYAFLSKCHGGAEDTFSEPRASLPPSVSGPKETMQ